MWANKMRGVIEFADYGMVKYHRTRQTKSTLVRLCLLLHELGKMTYIDLLSMRRRPPASVNAVGNLRKIAMCHRSRYLPGTVVLILVRVIRVNLVASDIYAICLIKFLVFCAGHGI